MKNFQLFDEAEFFRDPNVPCILVSSSENMYFSNILLEFCENQNVWKKTAFVVRRWSTFMSIDRGPTV